MVLNLYQFLNLKDGFLHPVPDQKIDTEVEIDGWSYVNGYCGIKRNTNYINIGHKFIEKAEIEKTVRFGLMLKRLDTVLFIKTTVPLAVLLLVNYYCVFISRTNILDNIILAPVVVQKCNKQDAKENALELLDQMGIISQAYKYPNQLVYLEDLFVLNLLIVKFYS